MTLNLPPIGTKVDYRLGNGTFCEAEVLGPAISTYSSLRLKILLPGDYEPADLDSVSYDPNAARGTWSFKESPTPYST